MDELQLWTDSLGGDARAFAHIFDTHQARVVRHARRVVVSQSDAEDVAASAFLELWRLRRRVRIVNGSVLPWLLVTTTNLASNSARSLRRYERILKALPRVPEEPTDPSTRFDSSLTREQTHLLEQAMNVLAPRDASLLILTAIEGYSVADAARALGIKPDTARVRLHRAKNNARQVLTMPEAVP